MFTELLKIIFWFNPFIYFYKKAIISNHEFLADEGVIQQNKNIKNYQELILNEILKQQNPVLVHPFNFNNTKNRFIMMTKQNSKFGKAKRFLAIPVFAIATFAFAEKVYGNDSTNTPKRSQENKTVVSNKTNDSDGKIYKNSLTINEEIKNDTITPKKTVEAKITEIKPSSSKEKTVSDIALGESSLGKETIPSPPPPSANFVQAEFPGGMDALRKRFTEDINTQPYNGKESLIRADVYIAIDEKGTVTKIIADGKNESFNQDVERALKSSVGDTQWKPATDNGNPVKTTFRMPIVMTFSGKK